MKKKNNHTWEIAGLIIVSLVLSYLITAGILWVIMLGLGACGLVLPVSWSWGLSAVVWLIIKFLEAVFKK